MNNLLIFTLLIALSILSCGGNSARNSAKDSDPKKSEDSLFTHKNLTILLIRGEDQLSRDYLTLEEAMEQKKITLHETGNVDELLVDNTSAEYIFIMAGDIVKGGRQDRTISEDIVLAPGDEEVPLKSFCVEASRWGIREAEDVAVFSSSDKTLNNKALKIAARTEKSQEKVWQEVAEYQSKASEKVVAEVASEISPTSLQLTLENDKIKSSIAAYTDALQHAFDNKSDLLGFAFFINGKFSTAETFGKTALFQKMQKKLLEAAASEAFEQYDEKLKFDTPTLSMFRSFMETAEKATETSRQTSTHVVEHTKKTDSTILIRTVNTDAGKAPLHTSIYSTDGLSIGESNDDSDYRYGGWQRNTNRE